MSAGADLFGWSVDQMRTRDDFRSLSGSEKAAILVMALGEEHAAKLFTLMDEEEIREISQTMAGLGSVNPNVIERVFVEFADALSSPGALIGNFQATERLLAKALGKDRVSAMMEDLRGPAGRTMWEKLGNVNESVLANFLRNEYPQTVAVIISKIRPDHAARVLALLPDGVAMEVIMRMLRMEAVQKDVLDEVERTLRSEFINQIGRASRGDAHELIAEIFNAFDRNTENRFMTALEEHNQEDAERIKQLMFTFEDLAMIDPVGIQTLLREFDREKLSIALKGASEDLRSFFFANMSERLGRILRDEMQSMGPLRVSEIEKAQTEMVALAKQLGDAGDIVLGKGKGEDQLIY